MKRKLKVIAAILLVLIMFISGALGLIEFTPEQILCGDVDGDGFVKVAVLVKVSLYLVSFIAP